MDNDMSKFDDSFNFLIGSDDEELNLLDNPYISINVYEVNDNWEPKISEKIKFRKCVDDDKRKFMSKTAFSYYPNALCFEDKSQIIIENNWFDETYTNIYVAIEACNEEQYGKPCKELSEIKTHMKDTLFYNVI